MSEVARDAPRETVPAQVEPLQPVAVDETLGNAALEPVVVEVEVLKLFGDRRDQSNGRSFAARAVAPPRHVIGYRTWPIFLHDTRDAAGAIAGVIPQASVSSESRQGIAHLMEVTQLPGYVALEAVLPEYQALQVRELPQPLRDGAAEAVL